MIWILFIWLLGLTIWCIGAHKANYELWKEHLNQPTQGE